MRPHAARTLEISSLSAIEHLLQHRPERIQRLCIFSSRNNPRVDQLQHEARRAGVAIDVSPHGARSPEPVKAWIAPFEFLDLKALIAELEGSERALVLALDHLQDPQNFGAICRTAEGLGISGILLPKDRSVSVSAGVYAASVGAVETVPIAQVNNLGDALRKMKEAGFWILGTSCGGNATEPAKIPDFEKAVLVLGTELEGMSPTIEKLCDWTTQIPLKGKVQSLNVSVAGAILMWELTRRLIQK
jgi:23S rRNA (guanosine2251-2'-O)-methyltransferase